MSLQHVSIAKTSTLQDEVPDVLTSCRDMGRDCDFVATGETEEQVRRLLYVHAARAHPEMEETLTPEQAQELDRQIKARLKNES